jgi:hypothetical protein
VQIYTSIVRRSRRLQRILAIWDAAGTGRYGLRGRTYPIRALFPPCGAGGLLVHANYVLVSAFSQKEDVSGMLRRSCWLYARSVSLA